MGAQPSRAEDASKEESSFSLSKGRRVSSTKNQMKINKKEEGKEDTTLERNSRQSARGESTGAVWIHISRGAPFVIFRPFRNEELEKTGSQKERWIYF